jgi:hypothetical protein
MPTFDLHKLLGKFSSFAGHWRKASMIDLQSNSVLQLGTLFGLRVMFLLIGKEE